MWALAIACQEPGGKSGKLPPPAPEGSDSSHLISIVKLEGSRLHWLTSGTLLLAPWGPPAASGSLQG